MPHPLDLESLRCFLAAAERCAGSTAGLPAADRRSFRAAARAVALSPAAFSERIARLEDDLGAALFDRTTRRLRLTSAGERLLPRARACLAEAESCRSTVNERGAPPYELRVGTRYELGLSWLTPALGDLERARPERRLHLVFGDTPDLMQRLRQDGIDCLVTSARIAGDGLSYARLHQERYVFIGAPCLLAERPLLRREHCRAHALLELNSDLPLFRYFLDARPAGEEWSFSRVQHLGTIGAVRARALAGAGVAVLPHYFVRDDLKRGRLALLMPSAKLPVDWFRLVWQERHPRADALHKLAAELTSLPLR